MIEKYSKSANGNIKLSNNFLVKEFACKDGSDYILIDTELVKLLQNIRNHFNKPVTINSAYRNPTYNKKVGGASNSSHLKGLATDWHTNITITEEKFIKYAKKWKEICERHNCVGEAGLYTWGMHLGSHITYSKTFYNWDSRTGTQKNNAFKI